MNIAEGNKPVSDNIKKIIQENALSRPEIAKRAGLDRRRLWDMMNGYTIIRPAEVLRISKAIGVGVEELFAEESDVESQII